MDWFRFSHDVIDDRKVMTLEPRLFMFWVKILCIGSKQRERGPLPRRSGRPAKARGNTMPASPPTRALLLPIVRHDVSELLGRVERLARGRGTEGHDPEHDELEVWFATIPIHDTLRSALAAPWSADDPIDADNALHWLHQLVGAAETNGQDLIPLGWQEHVARLSTPAAVGALREVLTRLSDPADLLRDPSAANRGAGERVAIGSGARATGKRADRRKYTPGTRLILAAGDLAKEGHPVSLKAAAERAGVDRAHVREKYPEAVDTIRRLAAPDRKPRRATKDRRTGMIDALDAGDE